MKKNNKLPPVQGLWIGEEIGPLEQMSMKSFMAHGHPYHLYTYQEIKGVPEGVEIKDGNEILPEKNIYTGLTRGYTPFSDWFRWELMQKKGGIYMDTDIIALRPLDLPSPVIMCYEKNGTIVCPAVLKIPPEHPLVQKMINRCRSPRQAFQIRLAVDFKKTLASLRIDYSKGIVHKIKVIIKKYKLSFLFRVKLLLTYIPDLTKLGSKLYQRYVLDGELAGPSALAFNYDEFPYTVIKQLNKNEIENLKESILPMEKFFPVEWRKYRCLLDKTYKNKDIEEIFPNSYCIHLWNNCIQASKDEVFPDSFIDKVSKKYNVEIN